MMGRAHATSGALAWLLGCAVVETLGHRVGLDVKVVGTALCAGWALAPDLDHPSSTLARSLGPVTWVAAKGLATFSDVVHDYTRTRWDRPAEKDNCHRTFSHTLIYALLWYVLGCAGGRLLGPWAVAITVFLGTSLGIYAVLPPSMRRFRVRYRVNVPVAPVFGAILAGWSYHLTAGAAWWLGLAIGGGCLVHCLGDMMTHWGCPILWPIPLGPKGRKRTWYQIGPPRWLRFRTGGTVERLVVTPGLFVLSVLTAFVLAYGPESLVGALLNWVASATSALLLYVT